MMLYFKEIICLLTLLAISTVPVPCMSGIPVMTLTRDPTYSELLPTHTRYQITSLQNISLMDSVFGCLLRYPSCVGILHNANIRLSFLLMCYLNERSVGRTRKVPGWIFLSDLNVCLKGWVPFSGHCYLHVKNETDWKDAKDICNRSDAYLLQTETHEEALWVTEAFLRPVNVVECTTWDSCSSWIGANDFSQEGLYSWNHGSDQFNATFWYPDQPNNYAGDQDCAALTRSAQLNDKECSFKYEFVCERDLFI
ncbi:brevican core protein-like [Saccostrea echinata]|uniref:brevican core protein-like n=1 Tax=Saccostrea echinata TaxID=191078 RepID=UPI002A826FEE|nr:brevican core protein-like [Saccostrea echinata]